MCVPSLPESGNPKPWNSEYGSRNPESQLTIDIRNPSSTGSRLESGIHCVELMWQVLAVPISLLGFYLLLAWGALQTCTVSFCSIFFFSFYTFLFYPRHHELHPRSTTPACLRPTAFSYTPVRRFLGWMIEIKVFSFRSLVYLGPKKAVLQPVLNRLHSTLAVFGNNKTLIRWN